MEPEVHYYVKSTSLSHLNLIHTLTTYLFHIRFNIIPVYT